MLGAMHLQNRSIFLSREVRERFRSQEKIRSDTKESRVGAFIHLHAGRACLIFACIFSIGDCER